jgi:hypothetical protein
MGNTDQVDRQRTHSAVGRAQVCGWITGRREGQVAKSFVSKQNQSVHVCDHICQCMDGRTTDKFTAETRGRQSNNPVKA